MRQVRPVRPGPRGPGECARVPPRAPARPRSDSASLRLLAAGSSCPAAVVPAVRPGGGGCGCGRATAAAARPRAGELRRASESISRSLRSARSRVETGKQLGEQAPWGPSVRTSPLFPCLLKDLLTRNWGSPLPLWVALTPSSASRKQGRRLTPNTTTHVGPKPLAPRQRGASTRGNSLKKSWPRNESFLR